MRFHQGWWRAFVLAEDPGLHPRDPERTICSTVLNGEISGSNFLTPRISEAVKRTLDERVDRGKGLVEEGRLFNNLLSSQPLVFNFLGELKLDLEFATRVVTLLFPDVDRVSSVIFEFAPERNYTGDNSAFDAAFEVGNHQGKGLIGLECKYTDSFSPEEYDKPEYRQIYDDSKNFVARYEDLIASEFNQLFRNQLLAEALTINGEYDFTYTGLLCHPEDDKALHIANRFRAAVKDGEMKFSVFTYWDLIETMQKSATNRHQRELSMLLWARYLGTQLSERAFKAQE
jgi:hypothetical protein